MLDVTKMKDMLKEKKEQRNFFDTEMSDDIDVVKKEYLTTCGGSFEVPSKKGGPLNTQILLMGFDWDEALCVKMVGSYHSQYFTIPKEFVDKFLKLIANTKSQRDVVLKGIENLRNEEAED
jgi:hypothetical protein